MYILLRVCSQSARLNSSKVRLQTFGRVFGRVKYVLVALMGIVLKHRWGFIISTVSVIRLVNAHPFFALQSVS